MKGLDLYKKYTSKRDYTGSSQDEYAQTLQTIFLQIGDKIYPLLEKAEKENKTLSVKYPSEILMQEIDSSMIELV